MANNDVFAVLADKTRRAILTALRDGERPVGELVDELGVSQPTVSKHLKILREAGMVSMEAQGQRRLYAVEPHALAVVTDWVQEVVGGTVGRAPDAAAAEEDVVTPETAPVPVEAPEPVPAAAPVPSTEPGPDPSAGVPPQPPARGAGVRAAELLSSLSGFRRRTKHPRR